MPIAKFQLPDGRVARFEVPEGTPPEEVQRLITEQLQGGLPPAPEASKAEQPAAATTAEKIAGNPATRFALGAAAPFLGLGQLAAESSIGRAVLPEGTADSIRGNLTQLEEMKQAGMKDAGSEGMDWMGILGNVMSPVWLKAAKVVPPTKGLGGRTAQGLGFGAAAGATTPVTGEGGFTDQKKSQVTGGAILGGILPGAFDAVRGVGRGIYQAVEPALPGGPAAILKRFQEKLLGGEKQKVVDALVGARELVAGSKPTVGEAVADIPGASGLAAHQSAVSKTPVNSGGFVARDRTQEAARQAALQGIAGTPDDMARAVETRADNAADAYGRVRNDRIDPRSLREIITETITGRRASKAAALQDWGRFATTEAQSGARAANDYPVSGMPRIPSRYSVHTERAAEARGAAGDARNVAAGRWKEEAYITDMMNLLNNTVDDVGLKNMLTRPSVRKAMKAAAKGAEETGGYFPQSSGDKFSVQNLQRMKEALDDMVKNPDVRGIDATEAREIGNTREALVKWLSSRSPGWKEARLRYAEDSRPINQMQVGRYLEEKLVSPVGTSERPASFAQAMRDAPRTIKQSTGNPRYDDLGQVLDPKQKDVVEAVLADLQRKARYEDLARGTNLGGAEVVERGSGVHLPNLLSRPAMIANFLLKRVGRGADEKINEIAAQQYLDPKVLAEALKDVPPNRRQIILQEISRRLRGPMGTVAPVTAGVGNYSGD